MPMRYTLKSHGMAMYVLFTPAESAHLHTQYDLGDSVRPWSVSENALGPPLLCVGS